jgi:hypothetical protein
VEELVRFVGIMDEFVRHIPLTPKRLITVIAMKNIATHTVGLMSFEPSQNPMVIDAAIISRGRETSHSRA